MTLTLVRSCLISLKECSCFVNHWNGTSFFVSSLNGADTSLKLGMNLAQYVAIPRKLRTPLDVVGAGAFLMAVTFLGSGVMPFPENVNPKKVTDDL